MNPLAQIPELNATTALVIYGPMGIFSAFCMWQIAKFRESMVEAAIENNKEVKNLAHRIDGLGKAIWAMLIDSNSSATSRLARDELAKIEARNTNDPD